MRVLLFLSLFMISSLSLMSQSAVGIWKTIDDEDGTVKSHVQIFEENGKLKGKVIKLINPENTICKACSGAKKNQPIEGMEILWDLNETSSRLWESGFIMDPKNGKEYKCKMELVEDDTLNVRGFIGFSLLGRTQVWYRLTE